VALQALAGERFLDQKLSVGQDTVLQADFLNGRSTPVD
jgi:hypothetical protein